MKKFANIIEKYQQLGVRTDNIEYAIEAVKQGAKREQILENLMADYRGEKEYLAMGLLNEVFAVNGGEFKKENRGGYIYGIFMIAIGMSCAYYIYHVFTYGGTLRRPIWIILGAICCNLVGVYLIIKALRGKYRDGDDPFKDYEN
jgi:hypothetical protein